MENKKFYSQIDKQAESLQKIIDQLDTISEDQKHIGKFIGESVHSIRVWVMVLCFLTIINIIVTLLF
jgi:hypothetical protein